MRLRLLAISLFLLPVITFGQINFSSLNGPYTGNIRDLAKTSSGVFIAGTSNSVYRSPDGVTWTRTPTGTSTNTSDIEINTSTGLIYAAVSNLIFTSADQGLTWNQQTTSGLPGGFINKIKVAPNGNVWAVIGVGLYRANAATPTAFNLVNNFSSSINDLDFGASNQIYVSTNSNGVQVSANNGFSFQDPSSGIATTARVQSVSINSSGVLFALTDSGPYRSNNGLNWVDIKNLIPDVFFFGFIEIDASGNVLLFNNNTRKIFSVSNSGSTTTPVVWSAGIDYPISIDVNAAILSSATNWLVGTSSFGVASTTNAGVNWIPSSTGIKATAGSPRLYRTTTNRLFMGWGGVGYFVSIDDGANWDLLNTGDLNRNINGFITASDNSIIGYGNGIIRSTNNGQNWTLQSSTNSHSSLVNIGSTLYSNSFSSTILSSVDNGITWSSFAMTGLNGTPQKLITLGTNLYTFTNSTAGGLYRINTTTGVATLIYSPAPGTFFRDVQIIGSTIIVLGSSTSLFVSSDEGTNWTTKTIPTSARVWAFDDQNLILAATSPGLIYNSVNGGNNWSTSTLADATGFATDAFFTPQGVVYMIGANMAVNKSSAAVAVPKAPTNLVSLGKTIGGHFIQWTDNSVVESGYQLEESIGGTNTNYQLTGTLGLVSNVQNKGFVQLGSIDPVVPQFVRLRAVNGAGESAYTNEISITSMNVACVRPDTDLIPNNRSWTASTTVDPGFSAIFGCTGTVCPSNLGGTYSYSTVVTKVNNNPYSGATLTGTGSMTEQTEGVYSMPDFSFGLFAAIYGDSPALGTLRFKDACNCISYTGADQYGDVFTISIVSVNATTLVFNWTTTYGDAATTTLTRTDAKTWPALTSPSGSGPATDANVNIVRNSSSSYSASSYGSGLIITGRPSPTSAINFSESCGETIVFSNGNDIPNGNGTWNPATKTLTIKWQSNVNLIPFKATTTYVLNASDPIPLAPSLKGYIYSNNESFVNWSSATFASSYDIERSTTSGSGFVVVASVNFPATSYVDKNLNSGTQYFYRVKAKNPSGSSAASAEVSITPGNSFFRPVENAIALNFENQQGVTWGDLDGDGDDDFISPSFTNNSGQAVPPIIYENKGAGAFERKELAALVNENTSVSRGIIASDFNNDGKIDMYITRSSGAIEDLILVNEGNWNFTKTSLPSTSVATSQFRAAGAIDFDRDGKLDVFVANEVATPISPIILKNNGAGFDNVSSGLGDLSIDAFNSRNFTLADYDNDGDQDVFFTLSTTGFNRLYRNNGDGTFTRVTGLIFDTDQVIAARTSSWADIDNDGDLDLFVGSQSAGISISDRLYRNDNNGTSFTAISSPVAELGTSTFGSAFGDIDNDGDLDLIASNGNIGTTALTSIFINNGSGVFTKSTSQEILTADVFHIGGAFVDFDSDGFLDFYPAKGNTGLVDLPNLLYKNTLSPSSSRNWIQVKLVGTVSNFSAIGARVRVVTTSPARSQIREVSSPTGYGSQNSLVQHFGLGTATTVAQIQVRWPNGGTQTITNIPVNQIITITEDVLGPVFTFTPANGSASVNIGNTLKITLNEPGTPVAAKNIVVRKDTEAGPIVQTVAATTGVANGNEYTYTLTSNLLPVTTYFVSIDAGAFIDILGNQSLAVAPANWTFSTLDNVPPVITFSPPATLSKSDLSTTVFNVTATDNISISSVVMSYRKVTATDFQTQNGVFNAATNQYSFPLQAAMFNDMGLEYYFEAKDAQPNTTRSPATGNHFTRLTIPESLLTLSISAGSTLSAYKIISVPLDLSTNAVGSLFEELGAPDTKEWRLLKYVNSPQSWSEGFQSIARGEGYFIISKAGANIKFGTATSPNFTQATPFVLNLTQGFNLIGNPYLVPINWNDVRSGIPGVGELKIFQNGVYVNATTDLQPFEGGFVFANAAVNVPVKFKTSTGGRISGKAIGSDLDQNEWIVPLVLSQGNQTFNFGGIGMAKDASLSYDDMDDFSPPVLFEKQEIKFEHPEHFMKYFARDVVPTQSEYEWQFTVDTEVAGTAELQWDNTLFGENTNELYLMDVARQVVIDMRTTNQIAFDPKKSNIFKIYFGKNLQSKVKPEGVFLGKPFPNPTNTSATIGFTLPENNSAYQVQLEIYNSVGQRTEVLTNGNLQPGFYTSVWNIENNKNGLYFYRLSVTSNGVQKVLTEKIIINR